MTEGIRLPALNQQDQETGAGSRTISGPTKETQVRRRREPSLTVAGTQLQKSCSRVFWPVRDWGIVTGTVGAATFAEASKAGGRATPALKSAGGCEHVSWA